MESIRIWLHAQQTYQAIFTVLLHTYTIAQHVTRAAMFIYTHTQTVTNGFKTITIFYTLLLF